LQNSTPKRRPTVFKNWNSVNKRKINKCFQNLKRNSTNELSKTKTIVLRDLTIFREKPVIFLMKLLLLDSGVSWEYLENDGGACSLEKCRIEEIGYKNNET
jgi:hypothetical protein